jgi:hypothetical protein
MEWIIIAALHVSVSYPRMVRQSAAERNRIPVKTLLDTKS